MYVDSPLAVEATNIFHGDVMECFDEETMELIKTESIHCSLKD